MDKLDFVKQDKKLYAPPKKPEIIDVPTMQYLMFDGQGTPETSPLFQQAFAALYGVAYTIKFMGKKGTVPIGWQDFKIPPPEGLWWMANNRDFDQAKPGLWRWTLMLRMPEFVTRYLVRVASEHLAIKKKDEIYNQVRLESLSEGKSVQIMHVGPYETEAEDLAAMAAYTESEGFHYIGKHHEIYFGDPRRTQPQKLKTVLRHPITKQKWS